MGFIDTAGRHQSVKDAARWLEPAGGGLPGDIQLACAELGQRMIAILPDCAELTLALRELVCAQDNFIRAAMAKSVDREQASGWAGARG